MKPFLVILILLIVIVLAVVIVRRPSTMPKSDIDVDAISTAVQGGNAVLLDVRTDEERAASGYAEGSTHMDVARLEAGELLQAAHDMPVYTYCAAGGRAERAKTILQEAGFTNVTNIGGLSDWETAGGTVVR